MTAVTLTTEVLSTYAEGDRVNVTYSGRTYSGTVRATTTYSMIVEFNVDNLPTFAYSYTHPTTGANIPNAYDLTPSHVWQVEKVTTSQGEVDGTRMSEVARLTSELAEAKRLHRQDILTIAEGLKGEAERREYCGEFEEAVDELGQHVSLGALFVETASRSRAVEYCVSYSITGHAHITASSSDEAQELFDNDPSDYVDTYTHEYNVDDVEEN